MTRARHYGSGEARRVSAAARVLTVDEVLAALRMSGRHPGAALARWERRPARSASFETLPERLAA